MNRIKDAVRSSVLGGLIATLCLSVAAVPLGPLALGVGATAIVVPLAGCTGNQVETAINTALQSAENILAVADPSAAWVTNFRDAVTALQAAETSWKGGGAIAIVESALNTLAAVSAVIPITAPYAPLIGIMVAGIDAVLSSLPATAPALAAPNPYRGMVKLKGRSPLHPTHEGAYKAQWNSVVKANPVLAAAALK